MTRKLYREYSKDFEQDGLKWREVYIIRSMTYILGAEPFPYTGRGTGNNILPSRILPFQRAFRHRLTLTPRERNLYAVTSIFKVPLDDHTAVYWALQGLHQDDATVLADLKKALDQ